MLKTARGTQALIDLEDRGPDVLGEHVKGSPIPLWPQVRNIVSLALNELDYALTAVSAPEPSRSSVWAHLGTSLAPSRSDARFAKGPTPLCFVVGGTTIHRVSGKTRNWLVGDFADQNVDQTSVLQWAPLPSPLGPPDFSATWSLDPAATRAAAYARLSRRDPELQVRAIVSELIRQLDVKLRDEQVEAISAAAVNHERVRPHVDNAFARMLDRLAPSVVVMEGAAYGGWASLASMMKARGILVAEPQHGWIGPTHAAYNFGEAMHGESLIATLPDELLTFGSYWAEGLRFPGRITTIGKPYLELAASDTFPSRDRSEVLVVSSTADPDEMSQFVHTLRRHLNPSWTVRFRPHPTERPIFAQRYPTMLSAQGIVLDDHADVYESLRTAAAVIGVASTVLFEAPAFGCRVYVRDSPMIDHYVGDRFGSPIATEADLVALARRINSREFVDDPLHVTGNELWMPGALTNFQSWLEDRLQR